LLKFKNLSTHWLDIAFKNNNQLGFFISLKREKDKLSVPISNNFFTFQGGGGGEYRA